MRPISLTSTLVLAGMAALSACNPYARMGAAFLEQTPSTAPSFNVSYFFNTNKGGPFMIGGLNSTISLRPRMDLDYTLIAAHNCSACPSNKYDDRKSEVMGYLMPSNATESRYLSNAGLNDPLMFKGSFVKDILTPGDNNALNFSHQKNISYEFFLIHNVSGDNSDIRTMQSMMNDGYLGLASDLGSGN